MIFPPLPVKSKLTAKLIDQHVEELVQTARKDGMYVANDAFRKIVQDNDLRTWEASVLAAKFQEVIRKEPKL